MSATIKELSQLIHCPTCGVTPGEVCRTKSGGRASWPHGDRINPANSAWLEGYMESGKDWTKQIIEVAETGEGWASLVHSARRELRWMESETR